MSDVNEFMWKLTVFDVSKTPEALLNKIWKNYLAKKQFSIEEVGKKSLAAQGIAIWLWALSNYAYVLKKVQPKQEKYEEVKAVLDEAKAKLKQKMDELDAVKSAVAKLEADC